MKKIVATAISLIGLLIGSCAGGDFSCLEGCGQALLQADNKCEVTYAGSSDKIACSNKALSESHQCEARCYGNL